MKRYDISRYLRPEVLLIFFVLLIFIGVWSFRQRQVVEQQAAGNSVNLLIVPQANVNETITTNTQFTREIVLQNPSQVKIVNYELSLSFPASLLEVVSIDTSMSPLPTEVFSTFDNTAGIIRISRVDIGPTPTTLGTFSIGRIIFKARASTGTANVNFIQQIVSGTETGSTVIVQLPVDSVQNGTYVLSSGPTPNVPTATPTIIVSTTTPIPTTSAGFPITLTINMQGRGWKINNLAGQVSLDAYVGTTRAPGTYPLTLDSTANGQLSGANFRLPAGSAKILIKPVGFLNKVFTANVSSTTTSFNFTANADIIQSGDIDSSGKVNINDYNRLLGCFKLNVNASSQTCQIGAASVADLDGSGQVNSLDFSLMLSNWGMCDVNQAGQADPDHDGVYEPQVDACANN